MLFSYLGNTNEYNSCYFERGSLTEPCFINFFNQLNGATKILLGVPPRSLFYFFDYRIKIRKEYVDETYKVLAAECQKLNYRYDKYQVRFLVVRHIGYRTL